MIAGRTSLSHGDYQRFGQLVEDRLGLAFPENRRMELEQRLLSAFAGSTCADLDEYYRLLLQPSNGALEMDRLANALTVGETYFYRDAGQFDALSRHVLPEIIERRRSIRTLRLWSAGCASGEEAYSLAIVLRELLPDVDDWAITILGTDINTEALDRARKAVYGEWAFREEQARQWRSRYFRAERAERPQRVPPVQANHFELVPEVRRLVSFARLNLAGDGYPAFETNTTAMDLILCRNVTIYLSERATHTVLERLHGALANGGWLVVGHAEASPALHGRYQPHNFPGAVLYQRTEQSLTLPAGQETKSAPARAIQAVVASPAEAETQSRSPASMPVVSPQPQVSDQLQRARELLEYGRSEEARGLLLQAVTRISDPALCYTLLGHACANLGNWLEAERWCRQAIQADRLARDAYYTLGLVLHHQGRLGEAIEAMKKVVYVDRAYVLGHYLLADMYHDAGQWPQAQKALDNARRLLEAQGSNGVIPGSGGITTGRLYDTIVRQQQQWAG